MTADNGSDQGQQSRVFDEDDGAVEMPSIDGLPRDSVGVVNRTSLAPPVPAPVSLGAPVVVNEAGLGRDPDDGAATRLAAGAGGGNGRTRSGSQSRTRSAATRSRSRTLECILGEEAVVGGNLGFGAAAGGNAGAGTGSRVRPSIGVASGGFGEMGIPESMEEEDEQQVEEDDGRGGFGRADNVVRERSKTTAGDAVVGSTSSPTSATATPWPPAPSSSASRQRSATVAAAMGSSGDASKLSGSDDASPVQRRSRAPSNARKGAGGPAPIGSATVSIAFTNKRRRGSVSGTTDAKTSIARRLSLSSSHRSRRSADVPPESATHRQSQEDRHDRPHAHFASVGDDDNDDDREPPREDAKDGGEDTSRSASSKAVSQILGGLGLGGSSGAGRRRSNTAASASSNRRNMARAREEQEKEEEEEAEEELHRDEVVEHLDCIDPAVGTVGNLQNIGNTIIFPQIPGFSRKPVVTLPTVESTGEGGNESKRAEESRRRATITRRDSSASLASLTGSAGSEKVQRDDDDSASDGDDALDAHVKDVLSKRQRIKRILIGTWAFIKTPMGAITAIYGFLVAFWGAAIVLFLLGWINTGSDYNKKLWIEISSQVENGLFTVTGVGLIPWRVRDAYRMCVIWHYKLVSRRLRKRRGLPPIEFKHDLPDPLLDPTFVPVLTEKQQARLRHNQEAFAASQTWYRAHATETHLAFDINYALTITLLIVLNSVFQCMLCGTMWGLNRYNRPAWTTGCLIPLSFLCMIISSILIWQGGEHTKKRKEVEDKLREALDLPDDQDALIEKKKSTGRFRRKSRQRSAGDASAESVHDGGIGDNGSTTSSKSLRTAGAKARDDGAGGTPGDAGRLSRDLDSPAFASESDDIQMKALARVKHQEVAV